MNINVQNEYGKLKKVLVSGVPFCPQMKGIEGQKNKDITGGLAQLRQIFKSNGIDVLDVNLLKAYGKHFSFLRDPFFVVGDKMFIVQHKDQGKIQKAKQEIFKQLKLGSKDNVVLFNHEKNTIEGGDVIVHNDTVYVGQGGFASNEVGASFLNEHVDDKFKIVPMKMLEDIDGLPIRHLDCVFNPLSETEALMYPKGLTRRAQNEVLNSFNVIEVTGDEQRYLGTNVVSLGNRHLVSQARHERINKKLEDNGFQVSTVDFGNTASFGGALRCATCPVEREK